MKRTLQLIFSLAVAAGTLGLSSCGCCSCGDPAPPLRPLPEFAEIPQESGKAPIHYAK